MSRLLRIVQKKQFLGRNFPRIGGGRSRLPSRRALLLGRTHSLVSHPEHRYFATTTSTVVDQILDDVGDYLNEDAGALPTEEQTTPDSSQEHHSRRIPWNEIVHGPSTRLGTGTIANLTEASVIGTAGTTVVLSTVAVEEQASASTTTPITDEFSDALQLYLQSQSSFVPLTVTYQERHHGVGRIPIHSAKRRDSNTSSDEEILSSRAIDRALRPLLQLPPTLLLQDLHVNCSVQSHHVFSHGASGNPTALALNSASAALLQAGYLREPVACVHVAGMAADGRIVVDPTPAQVEEASVELLYAGTRSHTVMMEACSPMEIHGISEEDLVELMRVAHAAIQPLLDIQEEESVSTKRGNEDIVPEDELRASLGLPPLESPSEKEDATALDAHGASVERLVEDAYEFCHAELYDASLRLFGYDSDSSLTRSTEDDSPNVSIHPMKTPLLTKSIRGRREHLVFTEIQRLLKDRFVPEVEPWAYKQLVEEDSELISLLARTLHTRLLKSALFETTTEHGTRGDGRQGTDNARRTIRPISLSVPALPDVVHGSAIFSRGETQVLCTTTLGAPRDGLPLRNPYGETTDPRTAGTEAQKDAPKGPYDHLPVGSLRFLRSQEALVSDLNSRKVKADKEMTGESGTLDEVRRFFLHYDFPSYSTGEVNKGGRMAANRRAIGHGALAERALRPVMPNPDIFPYAVRVTSEVTSSNGSSSMATVCGATMALLDAGVPLANSVAGVSVGLALSELGSDQDDVPAHGLLLDITGTEDHYGAMDFKIGGTAFGVTALQLDVKQSLPIDILAEALYVARDGRRVIVEEMKKLGESASHGIISNLQPRPALKDSAPRVEVIRFDPLRKRDLIGPGGAVLRQLEDRFGVSLDLSQEGQCLLFGPDRQMVAKAKQAVRDLVADVEEGEIYEGTVIEIKDFGAIVELLRNKEGLLHVSELAEDLENHPGGNHGIVSERLRVGQTIEVLCTGVDPVEGSIRLSRKQLIRQRREKEDPGPPS